MARPSPSSATSSVTARRPPGLRPSSAPASPPWLPAPATRPSCCSLANDALAERPGRRSELVSAICVRLRPGEDSVCWARAGHPPPLRLPELVELSGRGGTFLLGTEPELELENTESLIETGEGLVVYTDGATDVRRGREMLGLEGLTGVLAPLNGLRARAIAGEAERAILAWADRPVRDDLCLVVLKPEPV